MKEVGSWFNYHWKMRWKRSSVYALALGGFAYSLIRDRVQLEGFAEALLWVIFGAFAYIGFYGIWKSLKRDEARERARKRWEEAKKPMNK